ncbi:hypothetical protein BDN72DRAFT_782038, partial [Pluteus cervinus]
NNVRPEREVEFLQEFPPIYSQPYPVLSSPTIVIDDEGRIIVWYLPDILFRVRQVKIWDHSRTLDNILRKSVATQKKSSWRVSKSQFVSNEFQGCINISPAWFQRGHDTNNDNLEVSALLKSPGPARKWVLQMIPTFHLLNAIARIIHPDQHMIGRQAINKLMRDPSWVKEGMSAKELMDSWTTVFSALAIILNRDTPAHRDMSSPQFGLDMMLSVGGYTSAYMTLPGLGLELLWTSGAITALSGPLIVHEVKNSPADRLCIAFYMRSNVHKKLRLLPIQYMTQQRHLSTRI